MRRAFLDNHLWIGGADAGKGILICLRSGRIIGTLRQNGAGWLGRAFVGPLRLLDVWRAGMFRDFSVELSRHGLALVSRRRDRDWVQQEVELLASVDEDLGEV